MPWRPGLAPSLLHTPHVAPGPRGLPEVMEKPSPTQPASVPVWKSRLRVPAACAGSALAASTVRAARLMEVLRESAGATRKPDPPPAKGRAGLAVQLWDTNRRRSNGAGEGRNRGAPDAKKRGAVPPGVSW